MMSKLDYFHLNPVRAGIVSKASEYIYSSASNYVNVFGGTLVSSTADILEYLEVINLNPRQYLTKMETSIELYGNVSGSAYIANASISTPTTNQEHPTKQDKNKSFASIDNIFSKIPGIGINATAGFNTGFKFSYEVDYGDNPHTTDREGRVFKTADLDIQFYFGNHLDSGLLGSFFQNLFVNYLSGGLANTIFQAINFDTGVLLGVNYHFKRNSTADTIENNDFQFTQLDATLLNVASGSSLRYITPGDRIDKEISLYFGTFSGDVAALCDPSSEVKYNINIGTLYQMWHQGSNYDYNFQNVFSLFRSISYRKKVGAFDIDTSKTKILSPKVADKGLTNQVVDAHNKGDQNNTEVKLTTKLLSASLDNISKDNFFFEGGLALDIQMEIDLGLLSYAFEFYFKNLYYKYVQLSSSQQRALHNEKLKSQIINIDNLLKKKAIHDNVSVVEGQDYYDILYSDGIIIGANSATEKGLRKYINDKIGNANINESSTEVIYRVLKGVLLNNEYLNGKQPSQQEELDYGINKILDFFSYVTSMGNLQVTLEAKAGVSFGGHLRVGEGLTAALALEALAEINYQGILFQNGALTDLDVNDPLRTIYQETRKVLGLSSSTKKIGAKTVFNLEKK